MPPHSHDAHPPLLGDSPALDDLGEKLTEPHNHDADHTHEVLTKRERTTRIVVILSAVTMVAELLVGWWTHSLALIADGWHMATHVGALGLAWLAYLFSKRLTHASRVQFNQKKLFALAGYTNAIGLGLVGAVMLWEAWQRYIAPENIAFTEAIPIAILGLMVNVVSARLLHAHGDDHHHDHNLRAAYVHIVADAVTSVLALVALVAARVWGVVALDPLCAAVGAVVVIVWAVGLVKGALTELLDVKSGAGATKVHHHAHD